MNARIKEVRTHPSVNLSQDAFGKRIGLSGAAISRLESGDRNMTESNIISICREFNVSESWLRFGEGDMFKKVSRANEISQFLGDILKEESDFKQRFIAALSSMTPDEWALLERKMREIMGDDAKK